MADDCAAWCNNGGDYKFNRPLYEIIRKHTMHEWLPGYPLVQSYAELARYEFFIVAGSPMWHRLLDTHNKGISK